MCLVAPPAPHGAPGCTSASPRSNSKPLNVNTHSPLRLWAVWTHEPHPPKGTKALDWMVLTTLPVLTFQHALERLAWYRERWNIEVYHRTLKSGCRIEERQLGSAKRLEACLALDLVVAAYLSPR